MTDDERALRRAVYGAASTIGQRDLGEHWCWELHRDLASIGEYDKRQLRGGAIERAWPYLCSSESEPVSNIKH
jgi:hypothetical protein